MILGFDASLPVLSVAIVGDGTPLAALAIEGRESRNEKLLPAIEWALGEAGMKRTDVRLLAVTRGPGSFTGVRIGLATAEGLALALAVPICALSTHEVVASAHPSASVLVINDAGRGEFYASGYCAGEETLAYRVATAQDVEELRPRFDLVIDVRDAVWESNLALLAALHARAIRDAGALDAHADTTPVYVRLAEADARLLAKQ